MIELEKRAEERWKKRQTFDERDRFILFIGMKSFLVIIKLNL